jgi:hypothetical protein
MAIMKRRRKAEAVPEDMEMVIVVHGLDGNGQLAMYGEEQHRRPVGRMCQRLRRDNYPR